ncbi:GPW/gp25 family protein [Halotia branconii]|uniref:GPW/gp25 family protein n=1 Tax=Halotia branconii CENA392 TaxID=1539056 RepID=A0AAJ6PBP0_9CYAN|nr:GPW/gp25 family protein [Halotia branconii]WGV28002.1 GPW/gp25 family protein [Halotia branconii CENA392]
MAKEFLGIGWKFPVNVDIPNGKISMSEYEKDIQEAIWIILATAKGERIMQPDFGCGIHNFVFATLSMATLELIKLRVKEGLTRWEPRIDVNQVKVSLDKNETGKIWIDINYHVRKTNTEFNLVYPFYLQAG